MNVEILKVAEESLMIEFIGNKNPSNIIGVDAPNHIGVVCCHEKGREENLNLKNKAVWEWLLDSAQAEQCYIGDILNRYCDVEYITETGWYIAAFDINQLIENADLDF